MPESALTTQAIVVGCVATAAVTLALIAYWRSQQSQQEHEHDFSTPKSFRCNECQKLKPRASFAKSQFKKKSNKQKEIKTFRCIDCTFREAGSSTENSQPETPSAVPLALPLQTEGTETKPEEKPKPEERPAPATQCDKVALDLP